MKQAGIILLFCYCVASSSAQAIECLSAPNRSGSGWWSWREIDGRKCWYKKVGAVPPKSQFMWPQDAKEAPPAPASTQQESTSAPLPATSAQQESSSAQAMPTTVHRIHTARVKPVEPAPTDLRLNARRVGLLEASYLSGLRAIGGTWEVPTHVEPAPDTFAARYGQW